MRSQFAVCMVLEEAFEEARGFATLVQSDQCHARLEQRVILEVIVIARVEIPVERIDGLLVLVQVEQADAFEILGFSSDDGVRLFNFNAIDGLECFGIAFCIAVDPCQSKMYPWKLIFCCILLLQVGFVTFSGRIVFFGKEAILGAEKNCL